LLVDPSLARPSTVKNFLQSLPILRKSIIRKEFEELKSKDLPSRQWYYNTSGGSTGEPIRLIQDKAFALRATAVTWLMSCWAGKEPGELEVSIWGSERDILGSTMELKSRLYNWLYNVIYVNAFLMTSARMVDAIDIINRRRPRLITAYAQSAYELAQFAERQGISVAPQFAVMTSAGTLYRFMREKIESVFKCRVYDRYGSREVSNVACQCSRGEGLHVVPWGNYVEIVDEDGKTVPDGVEGNILITCLANYAMPLLRYEIGDRGILSNERCACGFSGQTLIKVMGRTVDAFKRWDGAVIDGEYFTHLLYFRTWVLKFQVIQRRADRIVFRIVKTEGGPASDELLEIEKGVKILMGDQCSVQFDFVNELSPGGSGKYRYTLRELDPV
jgi:phenylacetate-CoA ligase